MQGHVHSCFWFKRLYWKGDQYLRTGIFVIDYIYSGFLFKIICCIFRSLSASFESEAILKQLH